MIRHALKITLLLVMVNCPAFAGGTAAGKVYQGQSALIREFMEKNNWMFWSPEDIKKKVTALAERGYENDAAIITAKILMRSDITFNLTDMLSGGIQKS